LTQIATAEARLRDAEWRKRGETQAILAALDGAAGRTKAVGGVVRDTVLDRQRDNPDIDMATELLPDEVMARAKAAGIAAYPTGIDHGTVTLRLGETLAEVTTLRQDVETDGRHAVVAFGRDWKIDAERRDFTLNALYAEADGTLFDPVDGLADCLGGRVRFIGDARRRIAEDGLRVFRFFRFSASHGGEHFDAAGEAACAAAVRRLSHLSAERIGAEMRRMLDLPKIATTLRRMVDIGLIDIGPEVLQALKAYERQSGRPIFAGRLALLIMGEPPESLQARWRLSNSDVATAIDIEKAAALLTDMKIDEAIYRFGPVVRVALDIAAVQAGWGEAGKAAILERLNEVEAPVFPLGGKDLLAIGMPPGPELGAELERLEREWIESGFALDRDNLLERARR
jgi:poly(A) polymerase